MYHPETFETPTILQNVSNINDTKGCSPLYTLLYNIEMNYLETVEYLFNSAPLFQQVGKEAYKEGLTNTLILDHHFNHPHKHFRSIHIAGTNGKGSCSHTLAAILQSAGYKTGLYTSPHLIDFRERIRVNGEPIPEQYVIDFVKNEKDFFEPLHPSFFELTTALAFKYFAEQKVEVAVIEVGLGGRLDCTNIIHPDLSIITNISLDHTQFLGNSLAEIAAEKAGIIKTNIPVIIGESNDETAPVFSDKAKKENTPIIWAETEQHVLSSSPSPKGGRLYETKLYTHLFGELGGTYQIPNTNTILTATEELKKLGFHITEEDIRKGFSEVCKITNFMGRWQQLRTNPTLVCDAGHNVGGIKYITEQLNLQTCNQLHIVLGMVSDKDIDSVLKLLPKNAIYYFTKATVKRAMDEYSLQKKAEQKGLKGGAYPDVLSATEAALTAASSNDFIFVGGSCFIVADLLNNLDRL